MLKTPLPVNKTQTKTSASVRGLAAQLAERIERGTWDTDHNSIGAQALRIKADCTSFMQHLSSAVKRPEYGKCDTVLGWESKPWRTKADVVEMLRDVARGVE